MLVKELLSKAFNEESIMAAGNDPYLVTKKGQKARLVSLNPDGWDIISSIKKLIKRYNYKSPILLDIKEDGSFSMSSDNVILQEIIETALSSDVIPLEITENTICITNESDICLDSQALLEELVYDELLIMNTNESSLHSKSSLILAMNKNKINNRYKKVRDNINRYKNYSSNKKKSFTSKLMWKKSRQKLIKSMKKYASSLEGRYFHNNLGSSLRKVK